MPIATGTAIALGAAGAVGGSLVQANAAKKAQQAANNTNQAIADATNKQNEMFFRISRGEVDPTTGYANSVLPAYFKGGEAQLAQTAMDYFNRLQSQGGAGFDRLQGNLNRLDPAIQASLGAIADRYNGVDLATRLQNAQPVFGARTNLATQQRAAIDQSLLQTMAGLNAERARGGFYGGSTFDRSRLLAATLGARGQASNLMSNALLANAEDERALRDANLTGMSDMAPIVAGLQNSGIAYNSPAASFSDYYQRAMAPLNFFRIGNQAFQQQMPPMQQPVLGSGAALGSALSGLGQVGMNFALQQSLFNQMRNPMYGLPPGSTITSGAGAPVGSGFTDFFTNGSIGPGG